MDREILHKLQTHEAFRERKNKNMGLAILLQRKYHLEDVVDVSRIKAIIEDASTMDRTWRKCLQDYPALRGKDYDSKKKLMQQAEIKLGYEVGYNQDIHARP